MSLREWIEHAEAILPGTFAPGGAEDPRWRAIIDIGAFLASHPEEIWSFVSRWGLHPQEDLRDAIATCLLEHLLELHFDLIFPHVRELARENDLFADTFRRCWKLGQAGLPENSRKFDELQAWSEAR